MLTDEEILAQIKAFQEKNNLHHTKVVIVYDLITLTRRVVYHPTDDTSVPMHVSDHKEEGVVVVDLKDYWRLGADEAMYQAIGKRP